MAKWLTRRLLIVTGTLTGFFLLLGVQMVEKGGVTAQVKSSGTMSRRLSYANDISTDNVSQLSFSYDTTVEATFESVTRQINDS